MGGGHAQDQGGNQKKTTILLEGGKVKINQAEKRGFKKKAKEGGLNQCERKRKKGIDYI